MGSTNNQFQENKPFTEVYEKYMKERSDIIDSLHEKDDYWEKKRISAFPRDPSVKKFGLDYHGVIDRCPFSLVSWATSMVNKGHEVHIITGSRWTPEFAKELKDLGFTKGISFTHFFSVTDFNIEQGHEVTIDDKGFPWMDKRLWNRSKGVYAGMVGLDVLWDDSPTYGRYFPSRSRYITYSPDNFNLEANEVLRGRACLGRKE